MSESGRAPGLTALLRQLIGALPPGMLVLVLLNLIVLAVAYYMFAQNLDARNAMLSRIIEACLSR